MRTHVLRWNRLKRRAAALGVDVPTLIRLDAMADIAHNQGDAPNVRSRSKAEHSVQLNSLIRKAAVSADETPQPSTGVSRHGTTN
jgi:hypothetical protein